MEVSRKSTNELSSSSEVSGSSEKVTFDEAPMRSIIFYLVAQEGSKPKAKWPNGQRPGHEGTQHDRKADSHDIWHLQQSNFHDAGRQRTSRYFLAASNQFSTYIDSQYLVNCADYLTYLPDALAVLGEDAYAGYLGDFLVGFSVMKERAYPAGLVVRKDIFDGLGYRTDDFSVTTEDYSSFDQITELFAKVKEAYPSMVCLDGTSIMGL